MKIQRKRYIEVNRNRIWISCLPLKPLIPERNRCEPRQIPSLLNWDLAYDAKQSIFSPANLQLFHTHNYTLNVKPCPFYSCFIIGSHCPKALHKICSFFPFETFLLNLFCGVQKTPSNQPKSQTNLKSYSPTASFFYWSYNCTQSSTTKPCCETRPLTDHCPTGNKQCHIRWHHSVTQPSS